MYALVDRDGKGTDVTVVTILTGLERPNGVAWHKGSLFVAETTQITRYDRIDSYAFAGQVPTPC